MAEDKKAAKVAANKSKKEMYDTSVSYIECTKEHGKMVKGKVYKVSASTAAILVDRKLCKEVSAPKAKK